MKPFQSYNKRNCSSFIMKGRVFFINFLTTFKMITQISKRKIIPNEAILRSVSSGSRCYSEAVTTFGTQNKESLESLREITEIRFTKVIRNRLLPQCIGIGGQSVMEYFIILAVVVVITALSVSAFLGKAKEGGEEIFNKAVTRITEEGSSTVTIKFAKMTDLAGEEVSNCSGQLFTVSQEIWEQLKSGNHSYIKCLICQCQCNLGDGIYIFERITSSEDGSWSISGNYKFKKSEVRDDCGI